jgi:hypothetical protein
LAACDVPSGNCGVGFFGVAKGESPETFVLRGDFTPAGASTADGSNLGFFSGPWTWNP